VKPPENKSWKVLSSSCSEPEWLLVQEQMRALRRLSGRKLSNNGYLRCLILAGLQGRTPQEIILDPSSDV